MAKTLRNTQINLRPNLSVRDTNQRRVTSQKSEDLSQCIYFCLVEPTIFWNVTRRRLVAGYRSFGIAFRSHLPGWSSPRRPMTMGPVGCPETSVTTNLHRITIPQERRPQLHGGGSLKYRIFLPTLAFLSKLSVARTVQRRMKGWLVNNELEGIWK
jgi:hypothetical protein